VFSPRTLSVLSHAVPTVSLAALGCSGLVLGSGVGTAVPSLATTSPASGGIAERLAVREISVDQHREARQLLHDFTLGQMTRHYWGGFAASLVDLGLEAPDALDAELEHNGTSTTLSLQPRLGDEMYVAGVARRGGRLTAWACIGVGQPSALPGISKCPEGWQPMQTHVN